MNRTADLAYWITERESMRLRKEAGPPMLRWGYSHDPNMGTVRYCNVHREDDKVTRWLAEHWRPKYNEVWHILLARLLNRIETLAELLPFLQQWGDLESVRGHLKGLREHGPIFGSAYTVSTNGHSMDKVDYIIDRVVFPASRQKFWVWSPEVATSRPALLHNAAKDLCVLNGVSSFMAGQIIADLKNTKGHPLESAPDWHTWATPGPGSLKGLTAYFGRPVTPSTFAWDIAACYNETLPLLPDYVLPIHMQDFQNCMCEFSKYIRVKEGNGHARNRYRAG
jgi:hypothetical protein